MSLIDIAIIMLYLILVLYLGLHFYRDRDNSALQYLLGGRRLTLPAFIMTLVSTWYGGILGVGEFSYRFGISNWLVFGVPYYVAALLFAFFLSQKIRQSNLYTIPQQLETTYDKSTSILGALFVFVYAAPAAYILMLGILLQFFFGWPLWIGIIAGALFSLIYVYAGGFQSVTKTDALQFVLMFAGFILLLLFSVGKFGGIGFLSSNLPKSHFVWHGGQGAMYIIMWFFIALSTLVEPAFYQRCYAAKHPGIVKKGVIISVLFWIVFDFLTTMTGLYARAALPDLANPVTAYLDLAKLVLPIGITGLFYAGLLATIMSTVDSYSLLAAMTIGRDFLWKIFDERDERIPFYTRIGLIISTLFAIVLAIYGQSVVELWKQLGSISTPALLIPVISGFFTSMRMSKIGVKCVIISGAAVSLFWTIMQNYGYFQCGILSMEPIFPGLLVTIIIFMIDKIRMNHPSLR